MAAMKRVFLWMGSLFLIAGCSAQKVALRQEIQISPQRRVIVMPLAAPVGEDAHAARVLQALTQRMRDTGFEPTILTAADMRSDKTIDTALARARRAGIKAILVGRIDQSYE